MSDDQTSDKRRTVSNGSVTLRRFWISWYTAIEDDPKKAPFQWWVSGECCSEPTLWTICAVIDAKDEKAAKKIALKAFPDAAQLPKGMHFNGNREGWRFCDEKPLDWTPGDRFPAASA